MKNMTIKRRYRGAVIVEFAILLPVFIFLVMGIMELGWALYVQNAMGDAARIGARIAATDSSETSASIISRMDTYMENANVHAGSGLSVDFSPSSYGSEPRGTLITITVNLPYSAVSILPTTLFLNNTTLQTSVTMAKEY